MPICSECRKPTSVTMGRSVVPLSPERGGCDCPRYVADRPPGWAPNRPLKPHTGFDIHHSELPTRKAADILRAAGRRPT